MGDQYLKIIIEERDYNALTKYLEVDDPNDIIEYLLNHLIEVVDQDTKEPTMISSIISFCFLIMHNNNVNIASVDKLVNKANRELKHTLKDSLKNSLSCRIANATRALDKIQKLIDSVHYINECGNPFYGMDLLWYVIIELKDDKLLKYLLNKNSLILQTERNGYNILEIFVEYFLIHLDDDFNYNRRILYMLLVTRSFNLDANKIDRLVKLIDSFDVNDSRVCEIRNIIINSFSENELLKTSYCCRYIKPKEKPTLLSKDPIVHREDFRKYYTVSIDAVNTCGKNGFCIDDAFTVIKKGGHYLLYVHVADVPSFIELNSNMDKEIRNIFIATGSREKYRSLFSNDLALSLFSLNQNTDCRTITIGVEIDASGNILDYQFYNGLICNYRSYYDNEANELFLKGNPLMKDCCDLASIISGEEVINTAKVVEIFNKLFGCLAGKLFVQNNYPGIFHNCPLASSLISSSHFESLDSYASQNISPTYLDKIKKSYPADTLKMHDLIGQKHIGIDSDTYMQFTSPIRCYSNIANLRGLREMIIYGNNDPSTIEFYHNYYEELVARANADHTVLKLR